MSCHSESLLLIKFLCPPSAMLLPAEPLANQPEKTFCLFFRPNPPPRMLKAFLRTSSLLYLNFCFSLLFLSHTCVHDSKEISSLAVKRKQKKKWPVTNKKKKRKLEKKNEENRKLIQLNWMSRFSNLLKNRREYKFGFWFSWFFRIRNDSIIFKRATHTLFCTDLPRLFLIFPPDSIPFTTKTTPVRIGLISLRRLYLDKTPEIQLPTPKPNQTHPTTTTRKIPVQPLPRIPYHQHFLCYVSMIRDCHSAVARSNEEEKKSSKFLSFVSRYLLYNILFKFTLPPVLNKKEKQQKIDWK